MTTTTTFIRYLTHRSSAPLIKDSGDLIIDKSRREHTMKILVVTACGKRKDTSPQPAWKLYKSPRIRAVYNRRNGHDMAILSSKYGLIKAEEIIEPYEEVLTEQRVKELIPQISMAIQKYDIIIYYRGCAGKEYFTLIMDACENAGKPFFSVGYKNLGDINILPEIFQRIERDNKKS